MEKAGSEPICSEEALNLLNCVAQSPYDEEKCTRLLKSLRECVLKKKVVKFSLADEDQQGAEPTSKKV